MALCLETGSALQILSELVTPSPVLPPQFVSHHLWTLCCSLRPELHSVHHLAGATETDYFGRQAD